VLGEEREEERVGRRERGRESWSEKRGGIEKGERREIWRGCCGERRRGCCGEREGEKRSAKRSEMKLKAREHIPQQKHISKQRENAF
jgi:hypothetical protein